MTHKHGLSSLAAALLGLAALTGCKLVAIPWVLFGEEPTRDVPAEFPHLADRKIAILVWADADTRFEYPHVQYEVASFVESALKGRVKGATFVSARSSSEFQNRNPDWDRQPPSIVGGRLGAQRVLLIELTQYTTREPESPHLRRGYISGSAKVYDTSVADSAPTYRTEISVQFPPDGPGAFNVPDENLRRDTMTAFADELAGKFHDRKVKVK